MIANAWTFREKIMLGVIVGLLILFGFFYLFDDRNLFEREKKPVLSSYSPVKPKSDSKPKEKSTIVVDVKGAVVQPGIYQLSADARVYQAIQAAGGLLKHADQQRINLAEKCKDEMVIYVPAKGEMPPLEMGTLSAEGDKINVNTASASELETLDGIGPSKAEAIVKYRETHGPFQSADQLTKVPGIGSKTVDKLKDQITF